MGRIIFVGLDVDDQSFHGYAVCAAGELNFEFSCKPNVGSLTKKLEKISPDKSLFRICYEATFLGFSLSRALLKYGYQCAVIAPSLIPEVNGPRVKTDRLDSRKLAEFHRSGLLTVVSEPSEEDEQVRDLVRSRVFLNRQILSFKKHALSICRRAGIDYRKAVNKPTACHWTDQHRRWLETELNKMNSGAMKSNLELMLMTFGQMEKQLETYDEEIERSAQSGRFARKVNSLVCYRGINTLTALTFITEIGDVKRFGHPRQLTSYCGLDLSEYSSGGLHLRRGITKMGNKHMRTAAVEVCQKAMAHPKISSHLKRRRKDLSALDIAIADRCMIRLYKKSRRLIEREKPRNKVKVACARELLGFVWESLNQAIV